MRIAADRTGRPATGRAPGFPQDGRPSLRIAEHVRKPSRPSNARARARRGHRHRWRGWLPARAFPRQWPRIHQKPPRAALSGEPPRSRRARQGPGQRGPQVVVLRSSRSSQRRRPGPRLGARPFGERHAAGAHGRAASRLLAAVGQPLQPILADRLQHAVARLPVRVRRPRRSRLLSTSEAIALQDVKRAIAIDARTTASAASSVQPPTKTARLRNSVCSSGDEQVVAPGDRVAHRLLPRRQVARRPRSAAAAAAPTAPAARRAAAP